MFKSSSALGVTLNTKGLSGAKDRGFKIQSTTFLEYQQQEKLAWELLEGKTQPTYSLHLKEGDFTKVSAQPFSASTWARVRLGMYNDASNLRALENLTLETCAIFSNITFMASRWWSSGFVVLTQHLSRQVKQGPPALLPATSPVDLPIHLPQGQFSFLSPLFLIFSVSSCVHLHPHSHFIYFRNSAVIILVLFLRNIPMVPQ